MRTCLKRYAVSLRQRRTQLLDDEVAELEVFEGLLDALARRRGTRPRRPRSCGRSQRPAAARPSTPGSSRSMRAAINACSVSGIPMAACSSPHSATVSMTSSRKSGLPPVFSRSARRVSGEMSPTSLRASISCSLSASPSGSSSIEVARTRPPPQSERTSSSSGRERQRIKSEPSRTQSVMCSISSSRGSSAQWMSSKTRIRGCVCAISCAHSRAAHAISCWLRSP